ncbi:MAG: hypothetical protein SGCHY_004696 [Lobulomycetales sp.]
MAPLASASANDEQVLQRIFGVGDGAFEDLAPESESGSLRTDLNVPDEELRRSLREGEARAVALAANVDGHEEALRLLNALLRSCRSHASLYANRAQLLLLMEPSLVQKVALDDADVIAFTDQNGNERALSKESMRELARLDLDRAIEYGAGLPKVLANAYTMRALLKVDPSLKKERQEELLLQDKDLIQGARFGNPVAKKCLKEANPYAKMCGAILKQAMASENVSMNL